MTTTDPPATVDTASMATMRRFAVDWLSSADGTVCDEIMSPDYRVDIGGVVLSGRDDYRVATLGQLEQFPGLLITIHAVLNAGDRVAMRFTEHGPSVKHDGRTAAWRGIGLFFLSDGRLVRNITEEDYSSRRRQLDSGLADDVDRPLVAPWATARRAPDLDAETTVRQWLLRDPAFTTESVEVDDGRGHGDPELATVSVQVHELFSSGRDVAFHAVESGVPAAAPSGPPLALSVVGLVSVADNGTIHGHVVRDTAGLMRALRRRDG